jgi:hypothetical protein
MKYKVNKENKFHSPGENLANYDVMMEGGKKEEREWGRERVGGREGRRRGRRGKKEEEGRGREEEGRKKRGEERGEEREEETFTFFFLLVSPLDPKTFSLKCHHFPGT